MTLQIVVLCIVGTVTAAAAVFCFWWNATTSISHGEITSRVRGKVGQKIAAVCQQGSLFEAAAEVAVVCGGDINILSSGPVVQSADTFSVTHSLTD